MLCEPAPLGAKVAVAASRDSAAVSAVTTPAIRNTSAIALRKRNNFRFDNERQIDFMLSLEEDWAANESPARWAFLLRLRIGVESILF
jgi:hypothetical protein